MKIKRLPLNEQEQNEIVILYSNGAKVSDLCIKYNYSFGNRHGILNCLKKHNIPIRPDNKTHAKRYEIDETYFEKVDTQNKAYFLGLLYADGYNGISSNNIRLQLSDPDQHILEEFCKDLKTNKPLRFKNRQEKNIKWKNAYTLDIENKKMCKDLLNLGCGQAKTFNITFPKFLIPGQISHFIRGVFDGDGCITYSKDKKNMYISFTGTKELLESIQSILMLELGFSKTKFSKRFKNRNDNIYTLVYGGNTQVTKFKNWLYNDAQTFMRRKFEKFK